jgi:hypothetical protein
MSVSARWMGSPSTSSRSSLVRASAPAVTHGLFGLALLALGPGPLDPTTLGPHRLLRPISSTSFPGCARTAASSSTRARLASLRPPPRRRPASARCRDHRPAPEARTWTNGGTVWLAFGWRNQVILLGSRVFIPAYCDTPAHGWFRTLDTGGAIIAVHLDVYRAPPATLELHELRRQRVYVLPPGTAPPHRAGARCHR